MRHAASDSEGGKVRGGECGCELSRRRRSSALECAVGEMGALVEFVRVNSLLALTETRRDFDDLCKKAAACVRKRNL